MKRVLYLAGLAAVLVGLLLSANMATASSAHRTAAKKITVQICSSGPYGVGALRDLWGGARNGVDLAIYNMRNKLSSAGVTIGPQVRLDDAKPDGSTYSPDVERSNALKCINNNNAMGYVGTLNTGAAVVSEPLLNQAHLVQISPSNTGIGLTSVKPWGGYGGRSSQEPDTYKHKIPWVTYYRTVTTDNLQGPVGAIFAKNNLHATTIYVVNDKTPYGAGLALTFTAEAQKLGMKIVGKGNVDSSSPAAEAQTSQSLATTIKSKNPSLVFCGCDSETTIPLPRAVRAAGFTGMLMGGDALHNTAFITAIKAASRNSFATDVGPISASGRFRSLYQKLFPSFYKSPGPQSYDATAYDAASVILNAIYKAAKAGQLKGTVKNMRTMVVKYVHSISYCGATGCMHFDKNGDTSNRILNANKVVNQKWIPVRQLTAPKGFTPTPANTE